MWICLSWSVVRTTPQTAQWGQWEVNSHWPAPVVESVALCSLCSLHSCFPLLKFLPAQDRAPVAVFHQLMGQLLLLEMRTEEESVKKREHALQSRLDIVRRLQCRIYKLWPLNSLITTRVLTDKTWNFLSWFLGFTCHACLSIERCHFTALPKSMEAMTCSPTPPHF